MASRKRPSVQIPHSLFPAHPHSQHQHLRPQPTTLFDPSSAGLLLQSSKSPPSRHSHIPAAQLSKPPRKPAFQVYCDAGESELMMPTPQHGLRPALGALKIDSCSSLQTVVNDKENCVPEFEHVTLPAKRFTQRSLNSFQILGDKVGLAVASNCVGRWEGKIPFAPCSPEPIKPQNTLLMSGHQKLYSSAHSDSQLLDSIPRSHEGKVNLTAGGQVSSLLNSTIFVPEHGQRTSTTSCRAVAIEVNCLVAKLEALETTDQETEGQRGAHEIMEPLPANALCPGAPKLPCSFTMPFFDTGDDDETQDMVSELKSPSMHQVSPLAEVTEAYTGLQGGWSPPLETLSPVMAESSLSMVSAFGVKDTRVAKPASKKIKMSTATESEFQLDNLVPRLRRRREHQPTLEIAPDRLASAPSKGPMRI